MAVMAVAEEVVPAEVKRRLEAFAAEVLARAMNRPAQMINGGLYLRGLLGEGARKSLEPMVARLGEQARRPTAMHEGFPRIRSGYHTVCRRSPRRQL